MDEIGLYICLHWAKYSSSERDSFLNTLTFQKRKSREFYHILSRRDPAVVIKLKDGSDLGRSMPGQDRDLGERANGAQSLASKAES